MNNGKRIKDEEATYAQDTRNIGFCRKKKPDADIILNKFQRRASNEKNHFQVEAFDETYIKIKGVWHYLYRAVDKNGANLAGINTINIYLAFIFSFCGIPMQIEVRQIKILMIIEQDHRFIKKVTKPMNGFKAFYSADQL